MGAQQGAPHYRGGRGRSNGMQGGGKQYAMEADAALAVLQEQFPLYNQESLTDVLKVFLLILLFWSVHAAHIRHHSCCRAFHDQRSTAGLQVHFMR